jgi:hypothetical protein
MKRVVQDLGNEALMPPVDPEVMAATEKDWKCHFNNCRMPATHVVTFLDENNHIVNSFLVCPKKFN